MRPKASSSSSHLENPPPPSPLLGTQFDWIHNREVLLDEHLKRIGVHVGRHIVPTYGPNRL